MPCPQRAANIDVDGGHGIVVPMRLLEGDRELALFCTVAVFGSPRDITVAELAIESFFPADAPTGEFLLARHRADTRTPADRWPRGSMSG